MAFAETKTEHTFASLRFEKRSDRPGVRATVFFPNGYGASVICGPNSYGGDRGLYELAVLAGDAENYDLSYDTPVTDDVLGHLSEGAVTEALAQIASLPAREA